MSQVEIVCELSGGYDSAAALLECLDRARTEALFVDYGQPYVARERSAMQAVVAAVAEHPNFAGVHVARCDLLLRLANGAPAEYVPLRNLAIAALSANHAAAFGARRVAVGSKTTTHRADDAYCFRDCTTAFYAAVSRLTALASEDQQGVVFEQPLVRAAGAPWTKAEVLARVDQVLDLRALWNCYRAGPRPCGACFHCRDTGAAVAAAGLAAKYAGWWP